MTITFLTTHEERRVIRQLNKSDLDPTVDVSNTLDGVLKSATDRLGRRIK